MTLAPPEPQAIVLFGAWFVTLVIGMATDLDQRLLPNLLTLPVIPVALVVFLLGDLPLISWAVGSAIWVIQRFVAAFI